MNTESKFEKKIFRFKFSKDIVDMLIYFGKLHQYDNRHDYKDEWKRWYQNNSDILQKEERRLIELGFIGTVEDKMYKAGRYYFRKIEDNSTNVQDNKSQESVENKKRQYISLSRNILNAMDNHIITNINNNNYTPSSGLDKFSKQNTIILASETLYLENNSALKKDEIYLKIKKTYKNRYYLIVNNKLN